MRDICEVIDADKKYFIYGTAALGKYCYEKIRETYGEDIILAFVETTPDSLPIDRRKKVISLEEAVKRMDVNTYILITGQAGAEVMRKNCLDAGVIDSKILMVPQEIKNYLRTGFSYPLNEVCFWPPIKEECTDLFQKINFYLPDRIYVTLFADELTEKKDFGGNISFCDMCDKNKIWENSDAILLWDIKQEENLFVNYPEKTRIVDPYYWEHIDTTNYVRLYHDSFSEEELQRMIENSKRNFGELKKSAGAYKKANIFCSGPSIGEIYDMEKGAFDDGFNIICNSMIKDRELMERLRPQMLCFFDSNFYHSPGKYGEAFYKDLRETYQRYGYYVIVREEQRPLLLKHCPEMKEKLIGVPSKREKGYWFINQDNFSYRPLSNILLDIMIPIASSFFDDIYIAGCTGRDNEKKYFWKHNVRTQYLELKKDVMETWPAFFHYRTYESYYERHCQTVEEQLRYGESLGKKYTNLTTSYIPALQKRSVTNR